VGFQGKRGTLEYVGLLEKKVILAIQVTEVCRVLPEHQERGERVGFR
jgi:hypothetical protein